MCAFWKSWKRTEHELCQEKLSAFLDDELTRRERLRLKRHLEKCATCRADLEELRQMVALLRMTPAVKPPRSFFIPMSEVRRQRQLQRQHLAYSYLRVATAAATILLTLVVSVDAFLRYYATPVIYTRRMGPATQTMIAQPPMIPAESVELPTVEVTTEPIPSESAIVEQLAAAYQKSEALVESPEPGEAEQEKAAQTGIDGQALAAEALPSQTLARSAGPPPPSFTLEAKPTSTLPFEMVQPTPMVEIKSAAVPTATPRPTHTPAPPTATLPSTPIPLPPVQWPSRPVVEETEDKELIPNLSLFVPLLFLATIRPFLPWIKWPLTVVVGLLLTVTLWLRKKQRVA